MLGRIEANHPKCPYPHVGEMQDKSNVKSEREASWFTLLPEPLFVGCDGYGKSAVSCIAGNQRR